MELEFSIDVEAGAGEDQLLLIAERIRRKMAQLARQQLEPKTAKQYVEGLSPAVLDRFSETAALFLHGFVPTAIEAGCPAFDMKPGLLASAKVRTAKDGSQYVRVPVGSPDMRRNNPYNVRTISTKSPASAWQHPGIKPHNFVEQAAFALGYMRSFYDFEG